MRFKQWLKLNEGIENFSYSVPNDKKQQLFDFYMLEKLLSRSGLLSRSIEKAHKAGISPTYVNSISDAGGNQDWSHEEKIDYALMNVAGKLIPYLRDAILHAVYYSIASEMRHISSDAFQGNVKNINQDKDFNQYYNDTQKLKTIGNYKTSSRFPRVLNKANDKFYQPYDHPDLHLPFSTLNTNLSQRTFQIRDLAYKVSRKNFSNPLEFVKLAKKMFQYPEWSRQYGGKAWENICDGWLKLYKAVPNPKNKYQDTIMAIDHIYDLQHNTGTVFNKVPSYDIEDKDWLKDALNYKANASDPRQLYSQISPQFKKLAAVALKEKFGNSLEGYFNEKTQIKNDYSIILKELKSIGENAKEGRLEFVAINLLSLKYDKFKIIENFKIHHQPSFLIHTNDFKEGKGEIINAINNIKNKRNDFAVLWHELSYLLNLGLGEKIFDENTDINKISFILNLFGPETKKYLELAKEHVFVKNKFDF